MVLAPGSRLMEIHGVGPVVVARLLADLSAVPGSHPGRAPSTRAPALRAVIGCCGPATAPYPLHGACGSARLATQSTLGSGARRASGTGPYRQPSSKSGETTMSQSPVAPRSPRPSLLRRVRAVRRLAYPVVLLLSMTV